jgi:hypothetical protein
LALWFIDVEQQFNKVLTVRQSLAGGTSRYIQSSANDYQVDTVAQFAQLLVVLFPKLSKQIIGRTAANFIRNAITLKDEITSERAIYKFFFVQCGERYKPELIQASTGESGEVAMCTFPGLYRTVENNGDQVEVTVVKANARLSGWLTGNC